MQRHPYRVIGTAQYEGWDRLSNGELLRAAEENAVELLWTTDGQMRYQQNLHGRRMALVVLAGSTKGSRVRLRIEAIVGAVNAATENSYAEVEVPFA